MRWSKSTPFSSSAIHARCAKGHTPLFQSATLPAAAALIASVPSTNLASTLYSCDLSSVRMPSLVSSSTLRVVRVEMSISKSLVAAPATTAATSSTELGGVSDSFVTCAQINQ